MASCNFKNSKLKGATAAKMRIRHCCQEGRKGAKKRNKHIDLRKTKDNISTFDLTYEQCCAKYDNRIAEIDANGNTNKRKDRVTMVCIEVPAPADLPENQREAWFYKLSEIMIEFFGGPDNLIEGFWHVDEVHQYVEPESKKKVWSREHGHFCGVPVVQNGTLNAKKLTSRSRIIALNNAVEEMTVREFGCTFMTGSKRKSYKTVEELKAMSEYTDYKMQVEEQEKEIEKKREELRIHRENLERREREAEEAEAQAKAMMEKAEETLQQAIHLKREAQEKIQTTKKAEDADQPQKEKTKGREFPPEFEMLFQKWERERLGLPEPDMKQIWDDLEHRRVSGDSVEEDAAQEAQEEVKYHVPFEFVGFVPTPAGVHPSDEDEMGF